MKKMAKYQAPKEELSMPRWNEPRMSGKKLKTKKMKGKKIKKAY